VDDKTLSNEKKKSDKKFSLPDDLITKIDEDAAQRKLGISEYAEQVFEHFFKCKKTDFRNAMRLVALAFSTNCIRCGRDLPSGTKAWYAAGVGAVCRDCEVFEFGDQAIVAKLMKMRQIERDIIALKIEEKRLVGKVGAGYLAEVYERLSQVLEEHRAAMRDGDDLRTQEALRKIDALMVEASNYFYKLREKPLKKKDEAVLYDQ
jgi:hypothetical protein